MRSSPNSVATKPSNKTFRGRTRDTRSTVTVKTVGGKLAPHEDFYHWVLTLSWPSFFGGVAIAYVVTNLLFGFAFFMLPGAVSNANGFVDCFFFSVETFATIGYGEMSPIGRAGHALMTLEAFAGILASASITGVTFARLARPSARILFSEKAVIATRNGIPHLMFRMANWRRNQIVEAQLSVMVLLTETTTEGETMRRPTPLKLVRDRNAMFLLTWTAMHEIDASSPFAAFAEKCTKERLAAMGAEIFLSVSGLDETLAQPIHARYRYRLEDIVENARFVDIISTDEEGARVIDFDKFDMIEPVG